MTEFIKKRASKVCKSIAFQQNKKIDAAIDFLGGEFKPFRDYVILVKDLLARIDGKNNLVHICTRQEFEARKAEREAEKSRMGNFMYGNALSGFNQKTAADGGQIVMTNGAGSGAIHEQQSHWFDYENQKALRLPPAGEIVLVSMNGSDCKAKVLEVTKNDCENLIVCRVISLLDSGIGELKYFSTAKPLDWKSKSKSELHELEEIIMEEMDCCAGMDRAAKAILAAGYRKCHNKTPSDKE